MSESRRLHYEQGVTGSKAGTQRLWFKSELGEAMAYPADSQDYIRDAIGKLLFGVSVMNMQAYVHFENLDLDLCATRPGGTAPGSGQQAGSKERHSRIE